MKIIPGGFGPLIPLALSLALVLGGMALFSGCYTLKQGTAMLGYLRRAVPLETLESPGGFGPAEDAEQNRAFAGRVRDIRAFATGELGLRETKNYTRYVQIYRDYLAAVVSAAAKDSFTRHEWWFPVVGQVPYKGFFDPADARKEAEKLAKKGLDVWVRGVDAFSTLGWFRDPLYSYMRDYPAHRIAELLIHELLHATVYLKGQSQFNEELAEFVGREGARLYIISRFGEGSEEYRVMADNEADSAAFLDFIRELIAELDALYRGAAPREEKLERKEAIIAAFQERFDAEYENRFRRDNYRGFSKLKLNNAYLELYRLYYGESSFYEDLYAKSGRDLRAFIAAAKALKAKGSPKQQLEAALTPQSAEQKP
ncbi:MAG: aminopeptidase [Treponema sp.]|jgi:predicted aminopeptidase|nr:aminopeptidase [Treponema sp.]